MPNPWSAQHIRDPVTIVDPPYKNHVAVVAYKIFKFGSCDNVDGIAPISWLFFNILEITNSTTKSVKNSKAPNDVYFYGFQREDDSQVLQVLQL